MLNRPSQENDVLVLTNKRNMGEQKAFLKKSFILALFLLTFLLN